MGWGGKRAGSGRKRKPAANDNAIDVSPQPATVHATPRAQPMFSDASVQAIIEAMQTQRSRSLSRPRTKEWNPYLIRPERFGPVVDMVKKARRSGNRGIAMDDNSALVAANNFACTSWMNGGMLPNDTSEGLTFLGYPFLSELAQRPEFRLFGEIMSEEMTRKWIELRGTDDESTKEKDKPKDRNKDDEEAERRRHAFDEEPRTDGRNKDIERKIVELTDYLKELKVQQVFKNIAAQDSYFGIAHLYLDLKGANIDNLRDPENSKSIGNGRDEISKLKLGKGCLNGLRTIEPIWCYPTNYNAQNPLAPDWYDPLVWYVMGAEIHRTRLIPFIGRPVPDILKPAYAFGGLSMSQMAQPYVDIWLRTRESVGEIIHAFSVMVLSTNLATRTQPGGASGGAGDVIARMGLANWVRDNQGMMVIDKSTEDFKNISAPISGLDELQAQAQEHMFSVGRIPAVKFAGIQPKGLNATSEGELRAFNDTVHGQQEHLYRPGLTTVIDIAQISLWGERDPDITYDFLALHEMTPKEKAEIRKMEAETDQIRVDSGVVSQEEAREKLAADDESGYHGIDPDDVPDLLGEEEQGLIPEGSGKGVEAELGNAGGGEQKPAPGRPKAPQQAKKEGGEDRSPFSISALAGDEWVESKHPRKNDGKFAPAGGGGGGAEGEEVDPSKFKSKKDLIGHLLAKGTTAKGVLKATGWPSVSMPQQAAALGLKLIKSKNAAGEIVFKGEPMSDAEKAALKKAAMEAKAKKEAVAAPAAPPPAPAPAPKPQPPAAPAKPELPKPTEQELAQAKKSAPLKLAYVPGEKPTAGIYAEAANKMVEQFNEKYAGKSLTDPKELAEKVAHFKTMQAGINGLAQNEAKETAKKTAEAKVSAEKKQAEYLNKLKAQKEAAAEKNKKVMAELGITEEQAVGFNSLVQLLDNSGYGGSSNEHDLIEKFKAYEKQAKEFNFPISGFEYALIRSYINGTYSAVNKALRNKELTPQHAVYTKMLNGALNKLPKYKGIVERGTHLTPQQIAQYQPGQIVTEHGFSSTGVGFKFSGNVTYKIKANGMRGADFSTTANKGEKEVLFMAHTSFLVSSVTTKGGQTYIEMEEI